MHPVPHTDFIFLTQRVVIVADAGGSTTGVIQSMLSPLKTSRFARTASAASARGEARDSAETGDAFGCAVVPWERERNRFF